MAKRVAKPRAKSAPVNTGADDLKILSPDMEIKIAGRKLKIREYAFFESLEVAHRASALIRDMALLAGHGELRYDHVRRLFGVHQAVVVDIAAQSAGVDRDWVLALKAGEAESFLSAWFAVNSGFFLRELVVSLREDRAGQVRVGPTSSSPSPPPALEGSTSSADTPSGS